MQTGERPIGDHYDVVVIGGGVGGCIAAARLAQFGVNPRNGEKLKIALFEWGPYHKGEVRRGYGTPSRRAAFDGLPNELSRRYMLPWGSLGMVGGSTQWAGMIAFPPVEIDFEHWQAETGVEWTWENFTEPLAELHEMWHPYPEPESVHSPGMLRFRDSALALGYPVRQMGQAKVNCPRCGDCNGRVCKYDAKSTPLVTYIPIAEREGVQIIGDTPVEKIMIEKKGARPVANGIVYRKDGGLHQVKADTVIVSCGYNGTPRLLYRSGYGPRNKVQGELIAENENVGKYLVCSVNARGVDLLFDEPVTAPDIGVHSVYYTWRADPTGRNMCLVAESLGTREGSGFFPEDFAMAEIAPNFGREHKNYMKKVSTHAGHIRVEVAKNPVRGEITPDGKTLFGGMGGEGDRGGIQLEVLERMFPKVLEAMKDGQEVCRNIVKQMKPLRSGPLEGFPKVLSTNHNHGSCRAGSSKENSVVNSDLESHDVDNLFLCDASVVPFQCTANPSMPTIAICNYGWRKMVTKHFSRV